jgi:hypothetical protein
LLAIVQNGDLEKEGGRKKEEGRRKKEEGGRCTITE